MWRIAFPLLLLCRNLTKMVQTRRYLNLSKTPPTVKELVFEQTARESNFYQK